MRRKTCTTRDHIPPLSIYPKPRAHKSEFQSVPACFECNNGHHAEDEEFKVLITIDTSHRQSCQDKLVDSVAGTVGSNQRIAKGVFKSAQRVYAPLGNSKVLQPAVDVTFDKRSHEAVLGRIVRGLYWTETGLILPTDLRDHDSAPSSHDARRRGPAR